MDMRIEEKYKDCVIAFGRFKSAVIDLFRELFNKMLERAINIWSDIKELKQYYERQLTIQRHNWSDKPITQMKSQVINRKPLRARARSYC
ncbi:hypothetical protein [Rossellomorea sp. BNER]|uniref:hypothetical protein n=1 Tax=Rossellomorea sp. BNER TaxID=2962031 RepID=UPI003AF253F3|nr:hypothetical protein [Rossellomorea sp. BNER]